MSSVTSSFPPRVTLASALTASSPSVLATKAFADPNAGYPAGLRLSAALADNQSGNFSLASGLTVAGNAVNGALDAIKNMQSTLNQIQNNVAQLRDAAVSQDIRDNARVLLKNNLLALREQLREADLDEFNLLDATASDGVRLKVTSGAFTNVGKTPNPNSGGVDQRFAYLPNSLSFKTVDLDQAIDDLSSVELETYPDTDANMNTSGSLATVGRFQSALDQATTSLKAFKKDLATTAAENLTVSFGIDGSGGSADAKQIASRLAQALHNESFNLSANPSMRFFSLFA